MVLGSMVLLILGLWWNLADQWNDTRDVALSMARGALSRDVLYWRWNAHHQGVFTPLTPDNQPDPYMLNLPVRHVASDGSRSLVLVNPSQMNRRVQGKADPSLGLISRASSLSPLRPGNLPDDWERAALERIHLAQKAGGPEEVYEVVETGNHRELRLMRALKIEQSCLACHAAQGYHLGQVRGGLSVAVPLEPLLFMNQQQTKRTVVSHVALWLVGSLVMVLGAMALNRRINERDDAWAKLHTLTGLLPMCSSCKRIRDEEGRWHALESYIEKRSDAEVTHGLCPGCAHRLYPEHFKDGGDSA